jgi:hypothetical protein
LRQTDGNYISSDTAAKKALGGKMYKNACRALRTLYEDMTVAQIDAFHASEEWTDADQCEWEEFIADGYNDCLFAFYRKGGASTAALLEHPKWLRFDQKGRAWAKERCDMVTATAGGTLAQFKFHAGVLDKLEIFNELNVVQRTVRDRCVGLAGVLLVLRKIHVIAEWGNRTWYRKVLPTVISTLESAPDKYPTIYPMLKDGTGFGACIPMFPNSSLTWDFIEEKAVNGPLKHVNWPTSRKSQTRSTRR